MTRLHAHRHILRYLLAVFAITTANCLHAQNAGISVDGSWPHEISVTDINGRPFGNEASDIDGNPYFTLTFRKAVLILSSHRTFANIPTRINLAKQSIEIITSNSQQLEVSPGQIKEIRFIDTIAPGALPIIFRSGYQAPDKGDSNQLFQLLADGKYVLQKLTNKSIVENKNAISGTISREYETRETYFVAIDKILTRLQKNSKSLFTIFPDKKAQLENFMKSEKVNLKDESQLVKIFSFLNSL